MRTNNAKVRNTIVSVSFMQMVLAILLTTLCDSLYQLTPNLIVVFHLILAGFMSLFFFVHVVSKYFEYDSDGVKVILINKGLLWLDHFNYREYQVQFYKSRLMAFKSKNYVVYKSLTLFIKSSQGHTKKDTFNVTLDSNKKRCYIRESLSKMIKKIPNLLINTTYIGRRSLT